MKSLPLLLFALAACAQRPASRPLPSIDFQGHRGCRGLMPENTLPAMRHAVDLGVTTLEMDAVVTADSQLLLSHEPFFNHEISTAPDGTPVRADQERDHNIFRMTYAQAARYDVGLRPHPRFPQQRRIATHKPLLATVIDSMEAYTGRRIRYNIETKCLPATDGIFHPGPDAFAERLVQLVLHKGIAARTTIQSFDPRTLQYLHRRHPSIRLVLLVEPIERRPLAQQLADLGFTPFAWSPHYTLVNTADIAACHRAGIRVVPWTVNERADMERLLAMGVDGLISDYPDRYAGLGR
ncbi:glycerophosphodiester phosphodiesterase family protein [Flaviaesturariibacter amylovorans]|uniref:Glycerophosphodiester phosphodiesterase family protein n=1 Tax=Flaviaesturariibacter amylovorans TaxID=1084520 RepID=A0ABP8H846_9BACT